MATPEVTIHAPSIMVVGGDYPIAIDVTVEVDTRVDFITATLECTQGWSIGSGNAHVQHRVKFPHLVAQLMGEGVLPAGSTTRLAARFVLPPGTPPTHDREPAYARTEVLVHISRPWRMDGRYRHWIHVQVLPPARVERTPVSLRSTPESAAADKPRIEVALASTRLIAGETVRGSVALFHVDDRKPRDVELALVPMLRLHGRGRPRERRGETASTTLTLPAGIGATAVPFGFKLPPTLTPSFATVTHELAWWLVARSGSLFGGRVDVAVPLEIVDASAMATTGPLDAPPRLGDERIGTVFAKVAAREGWQGVDPDRADDDAAALGELAIERTLGDARLVLAYSYRGGDGTFVVARVEHPALGLGLVVTPTSSLRHVFFADVEVDIAAWDRAHHVIARTGEQAVPYLQRVVPALMRADQLGTLVRWDDDVLAFERPMSAIDEADLAAMTGELITISTALEAARSAIAPPPGVDLDLDAWRRLAGWLDATLVVGELSIDGKLDGVPVSLALEWHADGKPARIRVAVGDPEAASAELRAVSIVLARPAAEALPGTSVELATRLTGWSDAIIELRVADGVASAARVLGAPAIADAAHVRELIGELRTVLAMLSPDAGPYR